jgi:two-component system phosphate regulon response regulator OmpR
MSRLKHIFVVEGDPTLRESLSEYFIGQGLELTSMATAEEMFARIEVRRPDLVVLDTGLPGMSGLAACQRLRRQGDPIALILLTGHTDPIDRIVGLEMGADDYVEKPFSARELLARARAIIRRGQYGAPAAAGIEESIRLGDWSFQPASRSLHRRDEIRMLNAVEFSLLAELTSNPGLPVTRERLHSASHPNNGVAALLRAVDGSIMRLRKLVEPEPSKPRYIRTVRHRGYMFVPHQQDSNL